MESRGAALRLIATMLDSDLAPSDRAAVAFRRWLAERPETVAFAFDTMRTMARDYGRAFPWPQLWSFCREHFA